MQAMRIVYPTYESSNAFPGVLLVNIFFVASFGFGIAGGIYQFWQEHRLRRDRPWDFAAGPIELLREGVSRLRRGESLYETFQGVKQLSEVESMSESPYSRATWETTARAHCNGDTGHADVPPARAHAPAAMQPATPPPREPALRMLDILPTPGRELPPSREDRPGDRPHAECAVGSGGGRGGGERPPGAAQLHRNRRHGGFGRRGAPRLPGRLLGAPDAAHARASSGKTARSGGYPATSAQTLDARRLDGTAPQPLPRRARAPTAPAHTHGLAPRRWSAALGQRSCSPASSASFRPPASTTTN